MRECEGGPHRVPVGLQRDKDNTPKGITLSWGHLMERGEKIDGNPLQIERAPSRMRRGGRQGRQLTGWWGARGRGGQETIKISAHLFSIKSRWARNADREQGARRCFERREERQKPLKSRVNLRKTQSPEAGGERSAGGEKELIVNWKFWWGGLSNYRTIDQITATAVGRTARNGFLGEKKIAKKEEGSGAGDLEKGSTTRLADPGGGDY